LIWGEFINALKSRAELDASPEADAIVDRQVEELKHLLPVIYGGVIISSFAVALVFFQRLPLPTAILQCILTCAVARRMIFWRCLDPASLPRDEKRALITQITPLAFAFGLYCSLYVFVLNMAASANEQLPLLMLVGYCAVGVGMSLAPVPLAPAAVMISAGVPFSVYVIITGDLNAKLVAAILLASLPVGIRQYGRLGEILRVMTTQEAATDRQRRHARDQLRSFMEMASDWAWETDANHCLTYASPKSAELAGRPVSAIIGEPIEKAFAPCFAENQPETRVLSEALACQRNLRGHVATIKDAANRSWTIAVTIKHYFDDAGRYLGVRGWCSDITERTKAIKALEASERRFQDFAESAADWLWEADSELRYTYFSDKAYKATGVDHSPLLGTRMNDHRGSIDVADRLRHEEALARHLAFKDEISEIFRPSGDSLWIARSGTPVFDGDGAFVGYRGVCRDVTAEVRARKEVDDARASLAEANLALERTVAERTHELKQRTALLDEVIASMADGLAVLDEDLRIVLFNSKAAELSGAGAPMWSVSASVKPLIEAGIRARVYPYASAADYLEDAKETLKETGQFKVTRTDPDGRITVENVRRRPSGGLVITISDITHLRQREQQLERLTVELTDAKEAAESAARAKASFLANMSHEIRTPMNGVVGMSSLLLDTALSNKQREMVQVIVNSGDNLLMIINDILDFSKLDAGKMNIVAEPFDLRTTIEDVVALLGARVCQKGLEIMLRYQPTLGQRFIGDPGRLRQIITNVAGNAVKFTDNGHVLISVSGRRRGEAADIEILVEDTGCGIPADKLDKIFTAFEQVDNSAARRHDGTGLGLAISRRLVEAMGGDITATSTVGAGSTFRIRLPFAIDASAPIVAPSADDIIGVRALIVDDKKVNREILAEQLSAWGMQPTAAESGAQALDLIGAKQIPFEIIVLDHQMPGMDGIELARQLRQAKATFNVPLVLLTSVGRKGAPDEIASELFDAYLVKPARASMLLDAVIACLQGRAVQMSRDAANALSAAEFAGRPLFEGQPIDVLVAEDNTVNQLVIQSMLAKFGCSVRLAANGREAVEQYVLKTPDIVLTDLSMPELDGAGATELIRELQAKTGERRPIIGVTAHAMLEDRQRCIEAGMDDYLAKPVKPAPLRAMLEKWIASVQRRSA
jgi:PAS domain S-box-containing protein